jgi:hypothetical protein
MKSDLNHCASINYVVTIFELARQLSGRANDK